MNFEVETNNTNISHIIKSVFTSLITISGPIGVLVTSMFTAIILGPAIRNVLHTFCSPYILTNLPLSSFANITWWQTTMFLVFTTYLGKIIFKLTPTSSISDPYNGDC